MRTSFILVSLVLSVVLAEKYAMVFGTKDNWHNYSITSDPCRVYDDLIKAGIKPENIIFMAYSTDLNDRQNPYPGMIFTDPAPNTDGDWAKYGCFDHLDYTDKEINPEVFLGILSGDKEGVAKATGRRTLRFWLLLPMTPCSPTSLTTAATSSSALVTVTCTPRK